MKFLTSGKVKDVYELDDGNLLFKFSNRVSAYDVKFNDEIPMKGEVLCKFAEYWFKKLDVPNHFVERKSDTEIIVKKMDMLPIECVVRGYLSGSGWKEYQQNRSVCGVPLQAGLTESDRLDEPIFTPATKEESGHDENISFDRMVEIVGGDVAEELRERSLDIYRRGAEFAKERGLIIADTKFEWGELDGELILIDEVLTPDSSRFWPADLYQPGKGQPSFDKQFVRDWLLEKGWDKNSEPPELDAEIVAKTREKYIEAFEKLTQQSLMGYNTV